MKTEMSDSDYATDSIPSPPRHKENVYIPKEKKQPNVPLDEKIEHNSNKSSPPPKSRYNSKATKPVFNMIQVINSPHAHIGHTIYHNIPGRQEGEKIKETEKITSLKKSKRPVLDKDIDVIKDHIGYGWKDTFLRLGFSQGQIDQNEIKYHNDINGLIRWLLVDWKQANGKTDATVGVLANALWKTKQREALLLWSEKYDDLHK